MALSDTDTHHHRNRAPRRANIVWIGFLLIGGFYLVTEHRAHLFGILPFVFLPVCLVMHLFYAWPRASTWRKAWRHQHSGRYRAT